MQLVVNLQNSISHHENRNAFLINGNFYSYLEFASAISRIRMSISENISEMDKNIGLITNDDLETYAGIIALWLEGKAYIPINPENPISRNIDIINQASINTIIDSSVAHQYKDINVIKSKNLSDTQINLAPKGVSNTELAYLFFTSGTTGIPKGVPITRENLTGYVNAFWKLGININEDDKCLQMFELTFDLSVMSFLIPLLRGACVCTIPKNKIKYCYINNSSFAHPVTHNWRVFHAAS